jgi:soluble lytic murein transglycosylase-like protein
MIRIAAGRHGVPEQLVSAVIRVESGFNPRAVSRKGARGLMQLMPQTASILGVRDSFDPRDNIDGGVRHLRGLIDRFRNNLPLALAAYNAGEGAVNTHGGIPPYPETQAYVGRILAILGGDSLAGISDLTYRYVADDGAVVYTNIPPRGVVRRKN